MSEKPLISVVTVSLNAEAFIEQCIQSVLSQEFENFEYIVIDGGSTDGTVDIIQKHANRLTYWHSKPDRGLAHAFNLGVEHSKGQWLLFLNSDDFFSSSSVLADIAGVLQENSGADVVFGQVQIIQRQNKVVPISPLVGGVWQWCKFRFRSIIPHPSTFTNRCYFEHYGMFDQNFRNALDYELYLRAGKSLKAVFVPRLLVWMRDGGVSKDDAYRSFKESRDAQIKNRALSKYMAFLAYYIYAIRVFLKSCLKIRHGYMAHVVSLLFI